MENLNEQHGCFIGLNRWYIALTILVGVKLCIEVARLLHVRTRGRDSPKVHIIGNFIVMPLAFFAFFIYTQKMDKFFSTLSGTQEGRWQVTSSFSSSGSEAVTGFTSLSPACLDASKPPVDLKFHTGFMIISLLSYLVLFYYILAVTVLVQSACLIYVMVERRI